MFNRALHLFKTRGADCCCDDTIVLTLRPATDNEPRLTGRGRQGP